MKIGHVADIQVKNREKNLYEPYTRSLNEIIDFVATEQLDSIVLAGDLFEFAQPNDSERSMIYNFLSDLTNTNIKEIVLLPGNHDLVKDRKSQTSTDMNENIITGYNALNVFVDLLNALDSSKRDKFIYISKTGNYQSKVDSNVNYIGYSLEDNIKDVDVSTDKINIVVYHGMLKEYVDFVKLPIRKGIYESLDSIEMFPKNSVILAGDIHEYLDFEGSNGQKFYYPGSTQQHTHNEGSFYHVGKDGMRIIKKADSKYINVFDTKDLSKPIRHDLTRFVSYITLQLNHETPWEIIQNGLKVFILEHLKSEVGSSKTYIKIKTCNLFASRERLIFEALNKFHENLEVSFDYDKLVNEINNTENEIVQEIIKDKIISNEVSEDIIINNSNIDNLILSNDAVVKLFESVAIPQIKSLADKTEDITENDLKNDLISLFLEQLNDCSENSKRYDIQLLDIECNQFMSLGPNKIKLDYPGLVRILGTNGIGKTTLFRMLRWVRTGEVFEGMKSNQAVKNNVIIFNKNDINNDIVSVKLNSTINNIPTIIERTAKRNWKNSANEDNKSSINWQDFITGIDREVKLIINPGTENQKIIIGENAELNISKAFGETIDNILFVNLMKIESLLKSSSSILNELILNFIGVDYLQKLEDNLDNVKTVLMSHVKPEKNKIQIQQGILEQKNLIEKGDTIINDFKELNEKQNEAKKVYEKNLELLNDKLVNVGNVPEKIKVLNKSISEVETEINSFIPRELKSNIEFTESAPIKDQKTLDDLELKLTECKRRVNEEFEKYTNSDKIINKLKDDLKDKINKLISALKDDIKTYNSDKIKTSNIYTEKSDIVKKYIKSTEQDIDNKISKINEKLITFYNQKSTYTTSKDHHIEELKSGSCPTCLREYDNFTEAVKADIQSKIDEYDLKIKEVDNFISKGNEHISDLKYQLKSLSNLNDSISTSNLNQFDTSDMNLPNDILNDIETMIKCECDIIDYDKNIYVKNQEIEVINQHVDTNNFVEEIFNRDIIELYGDILKSIKEKDTLLTQYNTLTKESETVQKSITDFNNNYNESYNNWLNLKNKNLEDNKDIDQYNKEVNESILENKNKQAKLESLKLDLVKHNEDLKVYDETNLEITVQKGSLKDIEDVINYNNSKITETSVAKNQAENNLKNYQKEYDSYIQYVKSQAIWKVYQKLIKGPLKSIVFEYYRTFLNNTLNHILEDVNFKLFWDSNSDLYMISFENGNTTYQSVRQCSGMETVFCGLSLIYTISLLNIKNSISHLFIDELSGTLSKGTNLSYESKNYQDLYVKILNKFTDKTIFIVDHNIDDLGDTTYEVKRTGIYSTYNKI